MNGRFVTSRQTQNNYIYFIQAGDQGPIKIGRSCDPIGRFSAFQTASAERLNLLGAIPGGTEREKELHTKFQEFRTEGEWFSPAPPVTYYIKRLLDEEKASLEKRGDSVINKKIAEEAQLLVFMAAEPIIAGEKINQQKCRAFEKLRLNEVPAGWSKLHNAWVGRASWPTYEALRQQATIIGILDESSEQLPAEPLSCRLSRFAAERCRAFAARLDMWADKKGRRGE